MKALIKRYKIVITEFVASEREVRGDYVKNDEDWRYSPSTIEPCTDEINLYEQRTDEINLYAVIKAFNTDRNTPQDTE